MNDGDEQDPIELKPLQFSLRCVLVGMGAMAVLFAVLGPWLRQFPVQNVVLFGAAWIGWCLCVFGWVFLYSRGWAKTRTKAGRVLYLLDHTRLSRLNQVLAATSFLAMVALTVYFLGATLLPKGQGSGFESTGMMRIMSVMNSLVNSILAALALHQFLRFHSNALCENALLSSFRLYPWNEILRDEWHEENEQLWLIRRFGVRKPIKLTIRAEDRDTVEAVLRQVRPKYYGAEPATTAAGQSK